MNKFNNFIIFVMLSIILGFLENVDATAVTMQTIDKHIGSIADLLDSPDWEKRAEGLVLITDVDLEDKQLKIRLIGLLKRETEYVNSPTWQVDFPGESFEIWWNTYYKRLIELVGQIKDISAIPILLDIACGQGGPNLVKQHLAELGEPAALALLEMIKNPGKEFGGIMSLQAVISKDNINNRIIDSHTRQEIKELGLEKSKTGKYYVKLAALQVLGEFSEPEVLIHLQDIAENDSTFVEREIHGKKVKRYPVREEAQKQLDKHNSGKK